MALLPARMMNDGLSKILNNPFNLFSSTPLGRNMASAASIFRAS